MARSVWHRQEDRAAFAEGQQAAIRGEARIPPRQLTTYDQRAAFNDGWDSILKQPSRRRKDAAPPVRGPDEFPFTSRR